MQLRQAFRQFRHAPAFFAVCVLTLGLGIGLSTTVFSVVDGVLLRSLRFPDSSRIAIIGTVRSDRRTNHPRLTGGDWFDIQQSTQFIEAATLHGGGSIGVQVAGQAEFTDVQFVSGSYSQVFSITPLAGRWFQPSDNPALAVVSSGFALRHFGSFAAATGKTIKVENAIYEISGVVPYAYPAAANVWLFGPQRLRTTNRNAYNYRVIAKLKPNVSLEQAQSELTTLGARLASTYADNRNKSFYVEKLQDALTGPTRYILWLLLATVSLVLLIACANVANLLLARSAARVSEFAVRSAVGASRASIVAQVLTECVGIGIMAGAVGLLIAQIGVEAISRLAALALPRWEEVHIDWRIFLFTATISLLAAIIAGLYPAWRAGDIDVCVGLRMGGAKGILGGRSGRFRSALIVAQIAISVALSISAGLLFRSFLNLNSVELGYQPDSVLVMYAHLPAKTEAEYLAIQARAERIYTEIANLSGVSSVSAAMGLPAGKYGSNGSYAIEGKFEWGAPNVKLPEAGFRLAQPNYFATLGIPLRQGRDFTYRDQFSAEPVAIISESLARQSFGPENPLGRRIKCGLDRDVWMQVVGIVGDVRSGSLAQPMGPELYMPLAQHPSFANEQQVVIRTTLPPASLIPAVRQTLTRLEPLVPSRFEVFRDSVDDSASAERFRTQLFLIFAAAALLVSLAGVYSVTSYLVERRLSEFGLKVALGASPSQITRSILSGTGRLLLAGLALGTAMALAAGRWLESLLFGIPAVDIATYTIVLIAVSLVTLAAAGRPAMRAGQADPQTLLR
jgi:putative ABC transport system permease protein